MQALLFRDARLLYQSDFPKPNVGPGEALVRVHLAGICATDLEITRGYGGFEGVLGHEFVGTVEAAAEPEWVGRRVVSSINIGCGICSVCTRHGPEHCPDRTVLGINRRHGAFAEYVTVPIENLHRVPEAVPDRQAVFTEPLAAAVRIRQQLTIRPTDRIVVVGPGRLGLLIAQVLRLDGTLVTLLGRTEASLALPDELGLTTGLVDAFADNDFDLVVEATGNEAGFRHALRLVRPLGTLVLKSTFHGGQTLDLTKLVVGEITVVGSRCGPFEPALRLLAEGRVAVEPLIAAEYPLSQGPEAMAHAARPNVRKVLLRP